MTIDNKTLLSRLIDLSKIDVALARINADKKKLESELLVLHNTMKKDEAEKAQKQKNFDEKNTRYQREEKRLRDEAEKLVTRRKALTSLNNYKLQQSAEKEIEHASRQIAAQEEALLSNLDEVEHLKTDISKLDESLAVQKKLYKEKVTDAKAALVNMEERAGQHNRNRQELVVTIDQKNLTIYERVKERHIMDPLVTVNNNLCTGCNMQIGPQVLVLIGKGDSLVRCPGCARILYVAGSPELPNN